MIASRIKTHAAILATLLLSSTGCATANPKPLVNDDLPRSEPTPHILDGQFADWDTPNQAHADGRYIYLRFSPSADNQHTIQAAPHTTRIRIDTDTNTKTGRPMEWMNIETIMREPQGVDLLIELSPKNKLGSIGIGSSTTYYSADSTPKSIGHAALGFSFLPTHSSPSFEARIDRLAPGAQSLQHDGLIDIVIDQVDKDNRFLWSTTFTVDLPKIEPMAQGSASIPTKPKSAVRIMSANVLYSSPLQNPEPFDRVLNAINPDIILYQEWFKTDTPSVRRWIKEYAGDDWTLHLPSTRAGVAIATRFPIIKAYETVIPAARPDRPSRAAAALIQTDHGQILAISVHLKCCGSAGSSEDLKRIAQAKAINQFVREVHKNHPDAAVIIAGDFNLVGSKDPLDILANNLAKQHQDLSPIDCLQLGDASTVTWVDDKSRFSPGRLDWILIDESRSSAANAFILNTRTLSPKALNALGLKHDDSQASDHLPLVIDLIDSH